MPSLRSHFFRVLARLVATRMTVLTDLHQLRAFAATGSHHPLLPRGAQWRRVAVNGVTAEWITAPGISSERVLLYFHGGGWVLGLYNNHRWLAAQLSRACGMRVLCVDYRLAPEQPFPAALDDCVAVYRGLLQTGVLPQRITLGGDSAGGNLTVTTMLALRDAQAPLPSAGVCISPATDLECTGETFHTHHDAMLSPDVALWMMRDYCRQSDPRLPLLSPIHADLRGLPPLLVHVGEDEILLSDATRLAERARAAGVKVTLRVWPAMWHVWHLFAPWLPEAQQAVDDIGAFVRAVQTFR
jgi:monoterpene epsilon-lactone hydrolase